MIPRWSPLQNAGKFHVTSQISNEKKLTSGMLNPIINFKDKNVGEF